MKNLFKLTPVILFLALVSCSKDVELPGNPFAPANGKLSPNSPVQFNASIDGVPYSIVLDTTYMPLTNQGGVSISADTIGRIYHSIIQDTILNEPALWVHIGMNRFRVDFPSHILPTDEEFDAYFHANNRFYADTNDVEMEGVAFFMRDTIEDVIWSTLGPQPGSTFRVDQIATDTTFIGQHYIKARMVFKCILYNGSGGTKNLTNGVFVGLFKNT